MAIACLASEVAAQGGFSGVVVLSKGDTIYGTLSRHSMNTYECVLKTADGTTKTYGPNEVKAFFIPGEIYFESIELTINDDENQNVFMNVLAAGKADLLEADGHYYLRYEDEEVLELAIRTARRVIDGQEYIATDENYKKILRSKFSDCGNIGSLMSSVAFTRRKLKAIFNIYNECVGTRDERPQPIKQSTRSWGYAGLDYNLLSARLMGAGSFLAMEETSTGDTYSQNLPGVYLQFNPRVPLGLSFRISCYSSSSQTSGTGRSTYTIITGQQPSHLEVYYYRYDVRFKSTTIPVMMTYSFFNKKMVQPYVGVGGAYNIFRGFSGRQLVTVQSSGETTAIDFNQINSRDWSARYVAGLRIKTGIFIFEGGVLLDNMKTSMKYSGSSNGFAAVQKSYGFTMAAGVRLGR